VDVLWTDAELHSVTVDYDAVRLELIETTGRRVVVVAHGHIGVAVEGFWDEVIVADGDVVENHPFAERCWESIVARSADRLDSGSPDRNTRTFTTLVVTLIDGCRLLVAAARLEVAAAG
jgi:hypothetical protein